MAKKDNKMMKKSENLTQTAPVKTNMDQDAEWKARRDMQTLRSSAEILADPKRHKAAKAMAAKEAAAYKRVCK